MTLLRSNLMPAVLILLMLFLGAPAYSQPPDTLERLSQNPVPTKPATSSEVTTGRADGYLPGQDLVLGAKLSLAVLAFGALVLALQTFLLARDRARPEAIGRVLGLTTVIVATLFIVVAGFSAQQMAPALGLFGTVAGYLIARGDTVSPKKETDPS